MDDKYLYKVNKINLYNISSCSKKLSFAEEQKICELAEIAEGVSEFIRSMLSDGLNPCEIFSILEEKVDFCDTSLIDVMSENKERISLFLKTADFYDRAVFCTLLVEYLRNKKCFVSEKDFFDYQNFNETFVYVKNAFSDEAYDVFSQDFEDPRIRYAESFKEAIRLVTDDVVAFCLLPIEERGVRLPTVEELIFRSDSKINSVIPVFGYDGNADLKYALVSKNVYISDYNEDDDRYFEIRVPLESDALSSVVGCAEALGVKVFRINTLNFKTEDGETGYFSVVLKSFRGDFTELLIFLTLFVPDFIPVGIYKNLE